MYIRYCLACFLSIFSITVGVSQETLKKADAAFEAHEYAFAITYYKSSYHKTDDYEQKARIAYNIGLCSKRISKPLDAKLWFTKAIELKYQSPEVFLHLADVLRMNEEFDEAIEYYSIYKEYVPRDNLAEVGIESCKLAKTWLKTPSEYIVTNFPYFNSEFIDYSPHFSADSNKNTMFFASSRPSSFGDKIHGGSGQSFADLFVSYEDAKGSWSTPTPLSEAINTEHDEGSPSYCTATNTLYFTRCTYKEFASSMCKIYSSTFENSSWSKAEELKLQDSKRDTADYVHPSVSANGLMLYFASNKSGGYGDFDIWYCTRNSVNDAWGNPKNAGNVINTARNEIFPYLRSDNILFFASNGHIGMGGLDIFRVNKDAKGREYVLNLLPPINSTYDDYAISYADSEKEVGFFSSNRTNGSKGADDIFHFSLPLVTYSISGKIINELTELPIPYTNVRLIGSDGTSLEQYADEQGNYNFELNPQTNYVIIAIHDDFLNSKYKISTYGLQKDKSFDVNIYMNQIDIPVEVPHIMYDVNRWELRPESIVALEKLLDILNDNPHIIIELSSHTDYRVGRISNEELSQLRAQSVVNFLISRGINSNRLVAKGYGASRPKKIDLRYSELYSFLKLGDELTPEFIEALPESYRNTCHQINRRTEFRVISVEHKR